MIAPTPGPWRAFTTNGMGGWVMAASHVVATVNDPANARLIAAAPDLLAALRRVVPGTPCVISEGGIWCSEHLSSMPCCVAAARAAIKRAEGK